MKHVISRFFPILAGAVAVTGGWGLAAVGCGSSSGSNSASDAGGMDSTTDAVQGEAAANQDAASDVNAAPDGDAGVAPDGDAGATPDGDASTTPDSDAGTAPDGDAGSNPTADVGTDAEAGLSESSVAVSLLSFPGQLAAALCDTVATCCGSSGDAATFNWQACYTSRLGLGFDGSNTGVSLLDGGHVTFNAAQAQACLSTIATADCSANQITSAEQAQLFQSCYAAYAGTLVAGSPCAGSIECAPGNFCSPVDGGVGDAGAVGLCQALTGLGGTCGAALGANATAAQSVCSYRGAAANGLFCQNISGDAGFTQTDPATWTCQQQWANGSECYVNQDCASFVCHLVGSIGVCGTAGNWANTSTCSAYAIVPDAGAD